VPWWSMQVSETATRQPELVIQGKMRAFGSFMHAVHASALSCKNYGPDPSACKVEASSGIFCCVHGALQEGATGFQGSRRDLAGKTRVGWPV
jgi:hypothetical protein